MKTKKLIALIISLMVVATATISIFSVMDAGNQLNGYIDNPAIKGSSTEYNFSALLYYKSYYSNCSRYYNETLNEGNFVYGNLYINTSGNQVNIVTSVYNSSGDRIVNRQYNESQNGTIFTAFFPKGKSFPSGSQILFGNNIITVSNNSLICPASNYELHYGNRSVYYIPDNALVSSVPDIFPLYNYSFFFSARYIQSDNYALLNSISIPGNSTISAVVLGNIGIKTSFFELNMVKTNVRITSINYSHYIEKYIPIIALIWLIGIGYLVLKVIRRREN